MKKNEGNPCELVDILSVRINKNLSYEEKIAEYLRQIKNPYHHKCGKYSIKNVYSKNGLSLEECIHNLLWVESAWMK